MQQRSINFIGAGNMAKAIIGGLVNNGYPANLITVCAPSAIRRDLLSKHYGVYSSSDNEQSTHKANVLVLAVKPSLIAQICNNLRKNVDIASKLVISIAAGITLNRLHMLLGNNVPIVRVMPNIPCLVGKGMSGLYASPQICVADREFSTYLMSMLGKLFWLAQENHMNSFIATTSSAPAYFFLFMEAIQQQAQVFGFDNITARTLVLQTVVGVAALAANMENISFATLKESISSQGGTTAAALELFKQYKLSDIIASAMQAVVIRAEEMEDLF